MGVKTRVTGLEKLIKKQQAKLRGYKKFYTDFLREYAERTRKRVIERGFSGTPGMHRITGEAIKALRKRVTVNPKSASFTIYTNHIGARLHEEGGTIIAKTRRNLAIPLAAGRGPGGVPLFASPNLDVNYPGRFIVIKGRGRDPKQWYFRVFLKDRVTGQITHALQPSAYIPPQTNIRKTVTEYIPSIIRNFRNRLKKFLEAE